MEKLQRKIEELRTQANIPEENIYVFENYTSRSNGHEEDLQKTKEFLEFILACLKSAELTIKSLHASASTSEKRAANTVITAGAGGTVATVVIGVIGTVMTGGIGGIIAGGAAAVIGAGVFARTKKKHNEAKHRV